MPNYVEISLSEMKTYLEKQGFILHKPNPKTEWVANKIITTTEGDFLIRVYTSINPEDRSRGIGTDAIRAGCFSGKDGSWQFGTKRVNRTQFWKQNLQSRIQEIEKRLLK